MLHERPVNGAAWNSDQSRILTWTRADSVWLWDGQTGQRLLTLPLGRSQSGVQGALWSANGRRILSWSSNGAVRIWDAFAASAGEAQRLTMRHTGTVVGAAWNVDETRILSWAGDNTVRVWDDANGQELFVLAHDDTVRGAAWNTTETRILTWTAGGILREWVVNAPELIEIGRSRPLDPLTNAERQRFFLPLFNPPPVN
jgi:WD40 repeat protein